MKSSEFIVENATLEEVEMIKSAWTQVMPNSTVYARKVMGTHFFNFLLSKDRSEVANGILENDPLSYSARVDDGVFKELSGSLFVKPTEPYMAFGREKFRLKTIKNPTREQLVKRFTDVRNFIMSNADKLKDPKFNIEEK
jgi:hypothetical protein